VRTTVAAAAWFALVLAVPLALAPRGAAGAIAASYTRTSHTTAFAAISTATGATPLTFVNADDGTAGVGLLFDFTFNGTTYPAGSVLTVCVNGWATLATPVILSVAADNFQLYGGQRDLMAPWWDDLSSAAVGTNPAGSVLTQTLGAPGARRLVVQWTGVSAWRDLSGGQPRAITFQLVLEEGTNAVEFRYAPLAAGSYSSRESASCGLNGLVSVLDYLDAWTGTGSAGNGLLTTNVWPKRHLRFTPGAPTPLAGGHYTVGAGGDYASLSEACAELAHRGVAGPVHLDLTDARYDSTQNIFPIVLGVVPGASASRTVTIRSTGSPPHIVAPRGTLTGGFVMTADFALFNHRGAHVIVVGADHVALGNAVFTTEPGALLTGGLYVTPASMVDGASHNRFESLRFDLPNGVNGATAVIQRSQGPSAPSGACSNNRYVDLRIERARAGLSILGNASFPDDSVWIVSEVSGTVIGGATPAALANGGASPTVGLQANNVSNLRVAGIEVRNLSNAGTGGAIGIRVDNSLLAPSASAGVIEIAGNRVHDVYGSTGTTALVVGIGVSLPAGAGESRVYNNTVTELASASSTPSRNVAGLRVQEFGSGAGATHHVDFNSVRLEPLGVGCSSVALEILGAGAVVNLRNNVFANFAAGKSGAIAHYAVVTSATGALAAPGSVSDRNVLYVATPEDGYVGRDGAGNRATLAEWRAAVGTDGTSVAADPGFVGPLDLHVTPGAVTPVERRGSTFDGALHWAATDMDGEPRDAAAPDAGADEGAFVPADRLAAEPAPGAAIGLDATCVAVPVVWHRADDTPARGYSVTLELSPGLVPCGSGFVSAGYLAPGVTGEPYFVVTPRDSNRWTVDEVTLGAPCGATGGDTLFFVHLASLPDTGTASVRIVSFRLRDCATNAEIFTLAGPDASLPVAMPADWLALEPAPGARITGGAPCAEVPVVWHRTDATPARAYSVTVELDPALTLCGVAAAPAGYLAPGATGAPYFAVTPRDSNRWTVDEATLGAPCGAVGTDTLFVLRVTTAADTGTGTAAVRIVEIRARDCDLNAPLPGVPGLAAIVAFDRDGAVGPPDLAASRAPAADADGTIPVTLSLTPPPGAVGVQVWRRAFGRHPRYDDAGGAAPAAPASPAAAAAAGWTLTGVTAGGGADDPPARETWHHVAFSFDADGNPSGPSGVTAGVPNYRLGDVHDGAADCGGDNAVTTADVSFLGAHYGATIAGPGPFACLDVGPTVDGTPATRPLTDGVVGFDDLMILSLDAGLPGPPLAAARARAGEGPAVAPPAVALAAPARVAAGEVVEARVALSGATRVWGLSVALAWDPRVVEPVGFGAGDAFANGVTFSPRPGAADGARLAAPAEGDADEAVFATFTFRAIADGDPGLALAAADARDAANRRLLATPSGGAPVAAPAAPPAGPPPALALAAPRPNPARGATALEFSLPAPGDVALAVYSVAGRRVRTLAAGPFEAGVHRLVWDGVGDDGRALPAGLYWVRLSSSLGVRVRAVALLR